ncbi:uncharacterized protein LOC119689556 [Teleopsis dalmanni]|uniref:uncharacterized protein LOC119689556 n=1 Tax=Teleopsis dalmanni TaxID=139649 RepID=UPI0018CF88ED|nr:uncharacterized protein LOC119689556 [Teleopsis dalmanni]
MYNSKKILNCASTLSKRNFTYCNNDLTKQFNDLSFKLRQMHTTATRPIYAAASALPLPNNIDAAETTRFSPQRSRDISATVILSNYGNTMPSIDITADNSVSSMGNSNWDPHVQSYDCFGAVSLNSAMQSNVPTPFGGMHKFSHLNMPGGQWSQEYKFTSQNLQSHHYTALRKNVRSGWVAYDQNAVVDKKVDYATNPWNVQSKRSYCTNPKTDTEPKPLSKKDQMKKAFKEYGTTLIVFHVGISLLSLGSCYLLVSSGVDMVSFLEYLGFKSSTLNNNIAAGASTFVVSYAIHKVFAPIRISITLGSVPFIVRYLRSKGILKPKNIPTNSKAKA